MVPRSLLASLLVAIAFAAPASAEWLPLSSTATGLRVLAESETGLTVEITLAGVERISVVANGEVTDAYVLPGEAALMAVGEPQLPVLRRALLLPDRGAFEVRVLDRDAITLSTERVTPSKGHLTRNVDPATVGFEFGPVYRSAGIFPTEEVLLHEPFIVRDFRGATVEFRPFQYQPSTGSLEVTTRVVLEITPSGATEVNPIERANRPAAVDPEFHRIYQDLFSNFDPARYAPLPEPGRCVILSNDTFASAAQDLYEWKLQKGVPSTLTLLSQVGASATQIDNYLTSQFNGQGGLTYVILIGDKAEMPTMMGQQTGVNSDPTYSMQVGSDFYPDFLISRVSAQTLAQAQYQIDKFIRYEKTPDTVAPASDWYAKAVGIGSAEGEWSGYTDCQRIGLLHDMLQAYGFTETTTICDPTATKAMIFNALNNGRSMLNYIGHGSGTSWGTTGFNVNDVYQLTNGWMQPFILDVACSNGSFQNNECFAEAWLRAGNQASPRGAIAMYSPSDLCSWVPPCDMQSEAVRVVLAEERTSIGGSCFSGAMKVLDLWPGAEGITLVEQYNVFGDCSLTLRTKAPVPLTVLHSGFLPMGEITYTVDVPGVPGALCALSIAGTLYGSGYADSEGNCVISLSTLPPSPSTIDLTVTAYNHDVVIVPVEVAPASLAELVLDSFTATDLGEGTINGRIEAGEQVSLDLVLRNDGIEAAEGVVATLTSSNPHVTFVDAVASYGDIQPAEMKSGDAPYVLQIAPGASDGEIVNLELAIDGVGGLWNDALSFEVHAPVLAILLVQVDDSATGDGDGYLDPGEDATVSVSVENPGSGDAALLHGTLTARTLQVTITQNQGDIAALPSLAQGTFVPAFAVHASALLPPSTLPFTVNVAGGNGYVWSGEFTISMSNPSAVDDALLRDVSLLVPSPNPMRAGARLGFSIPSERTVDLSIYDARGRQVRALSKGTQSAGLHLTNWNGRDDSGAELASGAYFLRLAVEGREWTRTITILR